MTLQPFGLHTNNKLVFISVKCQFKLSLIDQYSPLLPTVGRFPVPMWLIILSEQLGIIQLNYNTHPSPIKLKNK